MAKRANLSNLPLPAKMVVGVSLCALIALVYFFIFYGDLAKSIESEQQSERTLRQELASARQLESEYQKDLAELTDRQQRQSELKKILPTASEYPSFLSALQSVANVSGVVLAAWAPRPEVPEEFYARVPMQLTLTGRFHQVAKFFYGVGQLPRIINMENISIREPKLVGTDVVVTVTVLATAFRALDPASDGKVGARSKRGNRGKR